VLTAKQVVTEKISRNIIFPIVLFFLLNIGNYSFLRYSLHGSENTSGYLNLFSQVRLILPLWIILYAFRLHFRITSAIFSRNWDVIALGISWMLSSLISLDTASYLLYGIWTLLSLWAILLFISYAAIISQRPPVFLSKILDTLWAGNFVILMLDLASMLFLNLKGGIYNVYFSSNTFWAYPTMIMGILALIKMRFLADSFIKNLLYFSIFLLALGAIYFSARRSPLICLVLTLPLLYLPLKLPQLLMAVCFFAASYSLFGSGHGKDILHDLPDSYMKYRMERMMGLVHGRDETSYTERQKLWDVYLHAFYQKPVLGEGLAAVRRITERAEVKSGGLSAHNTFVGLLSETGLSGTLLMFIVMLRSLLLAARMKDKVWIKIYLLLFIPTLLINWVEYNLIPGQIFFLYTIIVWLLPRGLLFTKMKYRIS
jgi:O-antigen ligase